MIWLLYTLILGIALVSAFSIVASALRAGITPMPTTSRAKEKMLEELNPDVRGKIYDLGSGWGSLLFAAAAKCPHAEIIGIENSLIPFLWSQLRRFVKREKGIKIYYRDFFDEELKGAAIVLTYLYPGAMKQLSTKLALELEKGALIISNAFALPGWKATQVHALGGLMPSHVYVYSQS